MEGVPPVAVMPPAPVAVDDKVLVWPPTAAAVVPTALLPPTPALLLPPVAPDTVFVPPTFPAIAPPWPFDDDLPPADEVEPGAVTSAPEMQATVNQGTNDPVSTRKSFIRSTQARLAA